MALWLLRPTADPDDPWWQGRRIRSETLVRARSAAEARVVAAEHDVRGQHPGPGNETHGYRSGYVDEKLYRVDRVGDEDGVAEVLRVSAAPTAGAPGNRARAGGV